MTEVLVGGGRGGWWWREEGPAEKVGLVCEGSCCVVVVFVGHDWCSLVLSGAGVSEGSEDVFALYVCKKGAPLCSFGGAYVSEVLVAKGFEVDEVRI